MTKFPRRGDVFLIDLDPTRGAEIQKARPCVVVSPDDLNAHLRTVMIAPMTTAAHRYPFRVPCRFFGNNGEVVPISFGPWIESGWFATFDDFQPRP